MRINYPQTAFTLAGLPSNASSIRLEEERLEYMSPPKNIWTVDSTKTCGKCNATLPATPEHFPKCKTGMFGLATTCRPCQKKINSQRWTENKEELYKTYASWRSANKDRVRELKKKYYHRDREKNRLLQQIRRQDPTIRAKKRAYMRVYEREKRKNDPAFHMMCLLRRRLHRALDGKQRAGQTIELAGCDMPTLMRHIESLWQPGMSWENHSQHGWHVDHIKPCAAFDLSDPIQQKECFHYTNLQPLWASDNHKKSKKYI